MTASPWRRVAAWLIDWAAILGWAAVTAAVGIPLRVAGLVPDLGVVGLNVLSGLVLVVPVVLALAAFESGPWRASPGKRVLGLRVRVRATGRPAGFGRALGRAVLKIGVPWSIGHAAVIALVTTSTTRAPWWLWPLVGLAYLLPLVFVASLFVGSGTTPYDRATGTAAVADPEVRRRRAPSR